MKKHSIIFICILIAATIATSLCIRGIIFFFNQNHSETAPAAQNFSDDILAIDVEIGAADIRIVSGTQFRVETDNPHITAEEKRGILIIQERPHIDDLESNTLTLYIPQQTLLEDVEITTGAGKLEIEELICRELDLELGAGRAEIHSLTAQRSADIEGGSGEILIHDSSLHNLDFHMGVGRAEIFSALTGNTEISAGIGQLALTIPAKPEDYTIFTKSGIGKIEVDGTHIVGLHTLGSGPNRIDLEGGIGKVSVYFEP